jgi:hypothetical protein
MYRKIVIVYSEKKLKLLTILSKRNVDFFIFKLVGVYNYYCPLKGYQSPNKNLKD